MLHVFHRRVNVATAKSWADSCMGQRAAAPGDTLIQLELSGLERSNPPRA